MLLTRSPLSPGPKPWFSLDLHVLSAPPAFVLSQDQTLREESVCRLCRPRRQSRHGLPHLSATPTGAGKSLQSSLNSKSCFRGSTTGLSLSSRRTRGLGVFRTLLSFQRPCRSAAKKSLRLAPEALRLRIRIVSDGVLWALQCRVDGTFVHCPFGQPRNSSRAGAGVKLLKTA